MSKIVWVLSILWCLLALLACQIPRPASPVPTAGEVSVTVSPATPEPQSTPSPRPVSAQPQDAPASTPDFATPPPHPSASPSPTLVPALRPNAAQQAFEDGDYALAIALWQELLATAPQAERAGLALALGRAYLAQGEREEAIAYLVRVVEESAQEAQVSEALGLLGGAYEALGAWRAAIEAYERYLALEDVAAPYVRQRIAAAHRALGEEEQAARQLEAIPLADVPPAKRAELLEELAELRLTLKDFAGALAAYDQILSFATRADYRPLVLAKRAEALRQAGRETEAVAQCLQILRDFPTHSAAYSALLMLDALGADQVDALQRGVILYHAGQYAAALTALQRYLRAPAAAQAAKAHYYTGLAYAGLRDYARAFEEYDWVIERAPEDPLIAEVWLAKARAAAAYGGDPTGIYHEFCRRYPQHPRAPEALWLAAVSAERAKDWRGAAGAYQRLVEQYPADSRAEEAAFRAGLALYAQGKMQEASQVWSAALAKATLSEARARLLTWLGLAAQASGDAATAAKHWQEAGAASEGYYGLRAQDLLRGVVLRLPPTPWGQLPDGALSEADWQALTAWVQGWSKGSAALDAVLLRRAAALQRLGWRAEALTLYRLLREQAANDPAGLLALARVCEEAGVLSVSISCAERLFALARQAAAPSPPPGLARLAYPTRYGHLVSAEAERLGVDPLLFLALIRQESRFDPQAVSYAGALGLTQVMPATGAWIAARLGEGDYRHEWLLRPVVSVRYGVWYLAMLLDQQGRDWVAALVGYNAGPGNLERWTGGQPIRDYDLFYETLPVAQTQSYLRTIYEQYRRYEAIYRPPAQ